MGLLGRALDDEAARAAWAGATRWALAPHEGVPADLGGGFSSLATTPSTIRECSIRPGRRHHDVGGAVVVAVKAGDLVAPGGADRGLQAQDVPAQGVTGVQGPVEEVVDLLGRLIGVHENFFQDDLAFGFQLLGPNAGAQMISDRMSSPRSTELGGSADRKPCAPWS